MVTMKTRIFAICLAAGLGIGGLVTYNVMAAAPGGQSIAGSRRAALLERVREKLHLTADQVTQIKAVIRADKPNLTDLFTRWHAARVELRTAIQADDATEATVRAAVAKVAAVEAEGAVERMKLFHQISPMLTAEQRTEFGQMQGQWDAAINHLLERTDGAAGE